MIHLPSSNGEHSGLSASRLQLNTLGYIKLCPVRGFALKPGLQWGYTHDRFKLVKHRGSPREAMKELYMREKYMEYTVFFEDSLEPGHSVVY